MSTATHITKVKELKIDFRGMLIRVFDIEYEPGDPGRYSDAPEDCYQAEPEYIDFRVDSGTPVLDTLLESDLRDEVQRDVIRKLAKEELI